MIWALAVLVLPAALQAADLDAFPDFKSLKAASAGVAVPQGAAAEAPPPPAVVSGVDMSGFLTRLEDMTLDTTVLRGLLGKIGVSFREPTSTANAQYGQILNNLYLPVALKDPARSAIRGNLDSSELGTVIHELTHASADHLASSDAPAGSAGAEHYKALRMISSQVRGGSLLARYPNTKADELAGYYMGCAVGDVAQAIIFLKAYNLSLARVADRAEADRLGVRLLGFDETAGAQTQPAPASWSELNTRSLGQCSVGDTAQFNGATIGVEPDFSVKGMLFQGALGLKPPLSVRELLKRLNDPARRSPGIDALRREVYEARLRQASAPRRPPPPAP